MRRIGEEMAVTETRSCGVTINEFSILEAVQVVEVPVTLTEMNSELIGPDTERARQRLCACVLGSIARFFTNCQVPPFLRSFVIQLSLVAHLWYLRIGITCRSDSSFAQFNPKFHCNVNHFLQLA